MLSSEKSGPKRLKKNSLKLGGTDNTTLNWSRKFNHKPTPGQANSRSHPSTPTSYQPTEVICILRWERQKKACVRPVCRVTNPNDGSCLRCGEWMVALSQ